MIIYYHILWEIIQVGIGNRKYEKSNYEKLLKRDMDFTIFTEDKDWDYVWFLEENVMLEQLKRDVYEACKLLLKYDLVVLTEGSVSALDQESGLFVIKPENISYAKLRIEDLIVADLQGNKVEGIHQVPADAHAHCILYKNFKRISGIVHTHSFWTTSWAQAGRAVPCYGTNHADYIYGEIPCSRMLTREEIAEGYEINTGRIIVDNFTKNRRDYIATPAVLCKNHGLFAWGTDASNAVRNAYISEECAKAAAMCEVLNPNVRPMPQELQDAYYDQKNGIDTFYERIS